MGASVSSNVVNMVTKTVATVSTDIIQKTQLSTDSTQIISVSDIDGDVTIKDNVFYQTANINMQALMNALTSESAQQSIVVQLSQEAKSLISGLNIGQFSDAANTMNVLIDATINILSVITQTCAAISNQTQEIDIKRVRGNVMIQNNVFQQVSNIIENCTQQAVANSTAVQDLKEKLDQSASATAEGLSAWAIAIILAVIFGLPIAGGLLGGYYVLKFIFPIIFMVGIGLIVAYYYVTTPDMKLNGYSSFISNTPVCLPKVLSSAATFANAAEANDACFKNSSCVAFDWKGVAINAANNYELVSPPLTTFYSYVSKDCADGIAKDGGNTIALPTIRFGPIDPVVSNPPLPDGDAYINTTTSSWFQKQNGTWMYQDVIIKDKFNVPILVGKTPPTGGVAGKTNDYYVYVNPNSPTFMYVYQFQANKGWVQVLKVKGPGIIATSPRVTNTSGFKVDNKKAWLLYLGIAAIIIGAVGTVITIYLSQQKAKAEAAAKLEAKAEAENKAKRETVPKQFMSR